MHAGVDDVQRGIHSGTVTSSAGHLCREGGQALPLVREAQVDAAAGQLRPGVPPVAVGERRGGLRGGGRIPAALSAETTDVHVICTVSSLAGHNRDLVSGCHCT